MNPILIYTIFPKNLQKYYYQSPQQSPKNQTGQGS